MKTKVIHAARIFSRESGVEYLLLNQTEPYRFAWYHAASKESEDGLFPAKTIAESLRLARYHWKEQAFRTLHCGMIYMLPERDEHGMNALFYQMVASYKAANGIFFDEDLGYNCFVNFASQEALQLYHTMNLSQ